MSDNLSPAQFAVLVGQLDILCGKLERLTIPELSLIDVQGSLASMRVKVENNMLTFCAATAHDRTRAARAIERTAKLVKEWTAFRKSKDFGERLKATRHNKYISPRGIVKKVGNVSHVNFRGH